MEEFQLLTSVAIALGLALAGGVLARFAGLSPIVGYLAAGVVISPFTPGYDADLRSIRELAELGVIFLMFGYATQMRSMSQGRASYSMEFSHYAEVPNNVATEIIGARVTAGEVK